MYSTMNRGIAKSVSESMSDCMLTCTYVLLPFLTQTRTEGVHQESIRVLHTLLCLVCFIMHFWGMGFRCLRWWTLYFGWFIWWCGRWILNFWWYFSFGLGSWCLGPNRSFFQGGRHTFGHQLFGAQFAWNHWLQFQKLATTGHSRVIND